MYIYPLKNSAMRFTLLSVCLTLFIQMIQSQSAQEYSVTLSAEVNKNTPSITIKWPAESVNSYLLHRKLKEDKGWGIAITTLNSSDSFYLDTDIEIGKSYEYRLRKNAPGYVAYGYANSGIEVAPLDVRGRLFLLVDKRVETALSTEIEVLRIDLESEGWTVHMFSIDSTENVEDVKTRITDEYNLDPDSSEAIFIVGNVAVPYSGNMAPDAHSDHVGAWPSDAFYGDVDGNWTDNLVNNNSANDPRNRNTPGDGKYDQNILPSDVEMQVGRIDLSNMPAFSSSEEELLRNYLNKNHGFRKKKIVATHRAIVDDNFGGFSGEAFAGSAWKSFSPMLGLDSIYSADYFTNLSQRSYIWSYGCGGGSYTSCNGVGNTNNFASDSLQNIFTLLFGSYFGDWDRQNNFLRAPLAQGLTLTNAWSGRPHWHFHHMGLGENIGYAQKLAVNSTSYDSHNFARYAHIALMGDPSLTMYVLAPPDNLQLTASGNGVNLSWQASSDQVLGYNVYRRDTLYDIYRKVNDELITSLSYSDNDLLSPGMQMYSVRAVKLLTTPSGSFFNISSGAYGEIEMLYADIKEIDIQPKIHLYPVPAKDVVYIHSEQEMLGAVIELMDLQGRVLKSWNENLSQQAIDLNVSDVIIGSYILRLTSTDGQMTKQLIIQR